MLLHRGLRQWVEPSSESLVLLEMLQTGKRKTGEKSKEGKDSFYKDFSVSAMCACYNSFCVKNE